MSTNGKALLPHYVFFMDFVQSRKEAPFCIGGWDGICCSYLFNVYRQRRQIMGKGLHSVVMLIIHLSP